MSVALPSKLENLVRAEFEDTCRRRFFFGPAFDPYGGSAGLYDLGPPLCAMKANLLAFWRQHFVLTEGMCEVDTTCLTLREVFATSGHVTRFNDLMVRDTVTGECIRADKFLEEYCDTQLRDHQLAEDQRQQLLSLRNRAAGMTIDDIRETIRELQLKSPKGNALSEPFPFNLMFSTSIGPEGDRVGYMRPELAQGIILNFKRLLDTGNAQRMPFAGACIGTAFRNEIAPRASLIRVREFTLAEIEHFMNPNDKSHEKFAFVKDVEIFAWPRQQQESNTEPVRLTIGDAVARKIIDNETLGYFMARTSLFLEAIGIRFVRFRQHLRSEMAHYAQDCWDAELLTSYGWVECVGIADRSAYDLTQHGGATKRDLSAREEFSEPRIERQLQRKLQKGVIGKAFGKNAGVVIEYLNNVPEEVCMELNEKLVAGSDAKITTPCGLEATVTPAMVQFDYKDVRVTGRSFIPSVIEPSFGVGRILFALLEQSYWVRRDDGAKNEKRAVFSLCPLIAPQKVAVFPLLMKPELTAVVEEIRRDMLSHAISTRTDDSGASIGKKYARVDELGIPFCVTCDLANDGCVTLRERDSAQQVRIPKGKVAGVVEEMCRLMNPRSWSSVAQEFPAQGAEP
ncbi:Anticodon binding domain [Trypanosoma vivax]|uniref:glycine--tRNA ligase n=1 Tax=Trypanosoma vivax (strain Y486) TaxID=1055687 RepID=G0UCI4_TRYVY|nr:putative glycyl-tRNA synthetase [Trypanosoma vivax]KAH8607887.1 Anticodon binding domain [Trypanosoma vivax]KAH8607965.1 Anticodon binding domain [Trypanosoma vivax]CCC53544.1 putative glycyl-tRNA synthetase [Trypanosoma vivax Y486]